jgi:hypothetical protein
MSDFEDSPNCHWASLPLDVEEASSAIAEMVEMVGFSWFN